MTTQHDELHALASREPVAAAKPDLDAIRHRGRRLRTRRRAVTAAATLVVVAGIAVPVAALVPGGSTAPAPAPAPAPTTSIPGEPGWHYTVDRVPRLDSDLEDGCGALVGCLRDAVPETGEVVGEPWAIAGSGDGSVDGEVDEVVYAVRPRPGAPVAIAVGFQDAGGLRRLALALRPGARPGADPVQVVGGVRRLVRGAPEFWMLGLVAEEPVSDVAWQTAPGTWRDAPLNDDLVEGHGVFWLAGGWSAEWSADRPAPVVLRVDGREHAPPA